MKCEIENCSNDKAYGRAKHCEMHYCRIRRHGSTELPTNIVPELIPHSHGYVLIYAPDHPLAIATQGGRVYEHRFVYYNEHGEGPFNCHWCGKQVTWNDMHVDHLNAIRSDNNPTNLVASCPPCNQERGHDKIRKTMRTEKYAKPITFNDETLTAGQWAQKIGINRVSLMWRLKRGWPLEKALTQLRGNCGPQPNQ